MGSTTHIAGIMIDIDGHRRQRCAWCPAVLIDGEGAIKEWSPGSQVTIADLENASAYHDDEGDAFLADSSCVEGDGLWLG